MKNILIIAMVALSAHVAVAQNKISANDASKHIGEKVTVCDKVYDGKLIAGSNITLLNLGGYYPNQPLTVVIKGYDRAKFPGKPEIDYKGRTICVTGIVVLYRGKPEIVASDPSEIQ